MKINAYKKLILKPNIAQEYSLDYPKKLFISNNSSKAAIKIRIGEMDEDITLQPNKTILKNDLYELNTTIRLESTNEAEVEILVNGDIRNNPELIVSGSGYDDTELRDLISQNAKKISDNLNIINDNASNIDKMKADINKNADPPFNTAYLNGDKLDVSFFTTTNLLQHRCFVKKQLGAATYEILLPLVTDDPNTSEPPLPPNAPYQLPDPENNNFVEIYFSCASGCSLVFKTQRVEKTSSSLNFSNLKEGEYKLVARYNIIKPSAWRITLMAGDGGIIA